MKILKIYLCVAFLLTIALFTQCNENKGNQVADVSKEQSYISRSEKKVSIIKLIADPSLYNNRTIQIKGFVIIEFENSAIYLNKEDCENGIDKNGIWIEISKEDISKLSSFNKKYVRLEGVFDMTNNGHDGDFSGAVAKIMKIDLIKK